jgi:HEAT repeats
MSWAHVGAGLVMPDWGADPSARFVQPEGTQSDWAFAMFTSDVPSDRLDAAYYVGTDAQDDPRTNPALLDRLRHDACPKVRKLIASRVLPLLADDPQVRSRLRDAASDDQDTGVRWAARYALRLSS